MKKLKRRRPNWLELEPETGQLSFDESSFRSERENILEAVREDQTTTKAASAAAEVRGELRSITSAVDRTKGELNRMVAHRELLTNRFQLAQEEAARFRTDCDEAGAIEAPLVDEVEAAERAAMEAQAAFEARQSLRNDAAEEASRWAARVEALQMALDAARARAGAERLQGVDGVLGTLLDLIEIDEGWEPAVEAALGESLTAVVVDDPAAGRRALRCSQEQRHERRRYRPRRSPQGAQCSGVGRPCAPSHAQPTSRGRGLARRSARLSGAD